MNGNGKGESERERDSFREREGRETDRGMNKQTDMTDSQPAKQANRRINRWRDTERERERYIYICMCI